MMKISTLFYTLKQGFVNIFRNKWYSLASAATISACLFLFGLFYAIMSNFQHIVRTAEEDVCVSVFFAAGTTRERMEQINEEIDGRDEVLRTEFISADDAWDEFSEQYLRGYEAGFMENPLEGMDRIDAYMTNVEYQEELVAYIETLEGVDHVNRSVMLANNLSGVNSLIAFVSAAIIIILLAVSIFLISNTVAIGISVRSTEINIMKYIGATDFFVRAPFILEGMLIGLAGAGVSLLLIYNLYDSVLAYMTGRFAVLSEFLNFLSVEEIAGFLTPTALAVGVGIGFLGSLVTVRKHLRV